MKIEKLTDEQKALLPKYAAKGIEIGLAVGADMDEKLIRDLTDKHRILCGVPAAANFIVMDSPFAALRSNEKLSVANALFGQHDINWLMFYAFFRVELGLVAETEKIRYLLELASHVGWMWMSGDTTIVTRRPTEIHLQARASGPRVLHNTTGYALRYRDGTGVCAVGGVRIPTKFQELLLDRSKDEKKRIRAILAIKNTEIRGALLRTLPPTALVDHLESRILDTDVVPNGGTYELLELSLSPGDTRIYLTGVCPSKGDRWMEAVPPTCTSVRAALSWREWGSLELPYLPPVVRT